MVQYNSTRRRKKTTTLFSHFLTAANDRIVRSVHPWLFTAGDRMGGCLNGVEESLRPVSGVHQVHCVRKGPVVGVVSAHE